MKCGRITHVCLRKVGLRVPEIEFTSRCKAAKKHRRDCKTGKNISGEPGVSQRQPQEHGGKCECADVSQPAKVIAACIDVGLRDERYFQFEASDLGDVRPRRKAEVEIPVPDRIAAFALVEYVF